MCKWQWTNRRVRLKFKSHGLKVYKQKKYDGALYRQFRYTDAPVYEICYDSTFPQLFFLGGHEICDLIEFKRWNFYFENINLKT